MAANLCKYLPSSLLEKKPCIVVGHPGPIMRSGILVAQSWRGVREAIEGDPQLSEDFTIATTAGATHWQESECAAQNFRTAKEAIKRVASKLSSTIADLVIPMLM